MNTVVFTPSGRRGEVPDGASVLDAARALGVDLDSVCGGRGICGRCQVVPMAGSFPKHGITSATDHLIAFTEPEERYRERDGLAEDRRLGCHAKICGDLLIDVPPESQIHRQVVRKEADAHAIEVDPIVRLHYVEIEQPSLEHASGDLQRLLRAGARLVLVGLEVDPIVLPDLQQTLRAGDWTATVAVRDETLITAVFPGFHDVALGVAFDVGSTTVAGHLCDLHTGEVLASAGAMNPQIRFGEDLMSRVSYVMMHPGGEVELTAAVRGCLDQLVGELCTNADASREDILELVVVGNPIMHHLVFGFDPTELGGAPFALVTDQALHGAGADLALARQPRRPRLRAAADRGPRRRRHRRRDPVGGPPRPGRRQPDRRRRHERRDRARQPRPAAGRSSPTGPAFEGAQISCGQRAAPGAIERVRIDPETLELRYSMIGSETGPTSRARRTPTGVCGSGIIELVAELFLAGVLTAEA